jgi:hypothetical protein
MPLDDDHRRTERVSTSGERSTPEGSNPSVTPSSNRTTGFGAHATTSCLLVAKSAPALDDPFGKVVMAGTNPKKNREADDDDVPTTQSVKQPASQGRPPPARRPTPDSIS